MKYLIIFLLIPQAFAETCKYSLSDYCISLDFEKISRKIDSKFTLTLKNKKGKSPASNPEVKLWMVMKNGHEHGSDPVKIERVENQYKVSNVYFLMRGTWHVKIKLDGIESTVPVCVGKDPKTSYVGKCK